MPRERSRRVQFAGTLLLAAAMARRRCCSRARSIAVPASSSPTAATRPRGSAQADIIYMGEGWNASVAVSRLSNGVLNYHNAGKVQASSEPQDMRLQRMLGHMTTLIPKNPRIGARHRLRRGRHRRRRVDRSRRRSSVTIAEIEPLVPHVVSQLFRRAQLRRRHNPKTHVQHRRRAALPDDDEARSSTRSRPTRSTRGSRARRCSTRASSSRP